MRYVLKIDAMGRSPNIEIDTDRFVRLKSSSAILIQALAIEQKYQMVISNYVDLEKESLNASVTVMVRDIHDYFDFFDLRLALNIRLVNLLTAVRLYTDQLGDHISGCLPDDDQIEGQTKCFFSTEHDKSFEFRFMEALRNHVQHSDIPVHDLSVGSQWTQFEDPLHEYSSYFGATKERLSENKKFKKNVLKEMPDKVNLSYAARCYIESISSVHVQARELISQTVSEARASMQVSIDEYKEVHDDSIGLTAFKFEGSEKTDQVAIFLGWDDVRLRLQARNRQLVNLRKRFATGRTRDK